MFVPFVGSFLLVSFSVFPFFFHFHLLQLSLSFEPQMKLLVHIPLCSSIYQRFEEVQEDTFDILVYYKIQKVCQEDTTFCLLDLMGAVLPLENQLVDSEAIIELQN